MPFVEVTLIEGRSREMMLELMRAITSAVAASLGVPGEGVRVVLREVPPNIGR